jgi:hypothetical protein
MLTPSRVIGQSKISSSRKSGNSQAGLSKAASKARHPHPEALLRSKSLEGCSRRRRSIQRAFRLFHTARWNRRSRPLRGASGRGQLGLRSSSERSRTASLAVTKSDKINLGRNKAPGAQSRWKPPCRSRRFSYVFVLIRRTPDPMRKQRFRRRPFCPGKPNDQQ